MNKNIFKVLTLLILSGCSVYDNRYEEGVNSSISSISVNYPGIIDIYWIEVKSPNGYGSVLSNQAVIVNRGAKSIDSVEVAFISFKTLQKQYEDILFKTNIKLKNLSSSDTIEFNKFNSFNKATSEFQLLNVSSASNSSINGFYNGTYNLYKKKALTKTGNVVGLIDFQGKIILLIDGSIELKKITGNTLSTSDSSIVTLLKKDNTLLAETAVKPTQVGTELTFQLPIVNSLQADSISIKIKK